MESEKKEKIDLKEAIKIAQILCKAPEERLPIILATLEKAGFTVNGLDEIEEWKAFKEQAVLIDTDDLIKEFFNTFTEEDQVLKISTEDFNNFCKERMLKPSLVRRHLANRGLIETSIDGKKVNYTQTVWRDGKATRCVVIKK